MCCLNASSHTTFLILENVHVISSVFVVKKYCIIIKKSGVYVFTGLTFALGTPLPVAQRRSHNVDRTTSIAQRRHNVAHNVGRTTSVTQRRSHNVGHTTSVAQRRSHNVGHNVEQRRSHNVGRTTSVTQRQSHNVSHKTSVTQRQSQRQSRRSQRRSHNVDHTTSVTQLLMKSPLTNSSQHTITTFCELSMVPSASTVIEYCWLDVC